MAKKTTAPKAHGVAAAKLVSLFDALAQQIEDADCREGRGAQKAAALAKLHEAKAYVGDFAID